MTLEEQFNEIINEPPFDETEVKQCVQLADEHAIGFAEWTQENRWFSFTDGFWHYTFEHGTAMSKENYNKHYRKTSQQLLEIYKKQNNL